MPADLDVVILRPPQHQDTLEMNRQFCRRFRIRRAVVLAWLQFLKEHHPGYSDMILNRTNLSQLPEDGNIFNQLTIREFEDLASFQDGPGATSEDDEDEDEGVLDEMAVPNILIQDSELAQLQGRVDNIPVPEQLPLQQQPPSQQPSLPQRHEPDAAHHISMPGIRRTPLNEFNRSQRLLSLACPSLFPRGEADFACPRPREISYQDYLEHAMKWEDGRFARHPTFRYIALNTLMRQQAHGYSKFYVNRQDSPPLTKAGLQEALEDPERPGAQAILNSISRSAAAIKGTRPYWYRRRRECEAFSYNLGTPHGFFTCSPADLHWRSLYRHMPEYDRWCSADERTRMSLSRRLLRENPHIAAWHFHLRYKVFREVVLVKKFNLEDWWDRYEWQGRGSSHNHGLNWFKGAPEPDMSTSEARAEFARIWGYHVSAVNPEPDQIGHGGDGGNPLSVDALATQPTWQWLSSIVNRCQRHHCSNSYCLRRNKEAVRDANTRALPPPDPQCRFHFPHEPHGEPQIIHPPGRSYWAFAGARNDAYMNQFNPLISMCWLANTDISPCTGKEAVVNYAAKYCSKIERETMTYGQISRMILPHIADGNPLLSFVSKMMNKLIGERDYSAQEVSHILLGLPLQEDSRVVRSVDCRPSNQHGRQLDLDADGEENEIGSRTTMYEKYLGRPAALEDVSYVCFLKNWNFAARNPERWRVFRHPAKPRVLCFFPRYKSRPDHQQFSDFCRVKLMLNHPHRDPSDLLQIDGQHFGTYVEGLRYCMAAHSHDDDHYGTVDEEIVLPDEDEFEPQEFVDELTHEDWQEIARMLPDAQPEQEPTDLLTRRDIDINYDWSSHIGKYSHPGFSNGEYWENLRRDTGHAFSTTVEDLPLSARDTLNREQRQVYDTFMHHFLSHESQPVRLQVDGGGGTGKSYMIKVLSSHLQQAARAQSKRNPILRAAPTGVASNIINGQTLHSLLRLPVDSSFRPLSERPQVLSALQRIFRGVKYLVIDEKSMLGLRMLGWVDRRLREIFPEQRDEFFGGISIILIGDFFQLPPVRQKPLYTEANQSLSPDDQYGLNAYFAFEKSVFLTTVQRQVGEEQAAFRQALLELREMKVAPESWQLLSSRCAVNLTQEERDQFRDALHIYPTKRKVQEHNHERMIRLDSPAIYVRAKNSGAGADKASSQEAGNLSQKFPVCVGCRVMLTRNIWPEVGLVNGALGTVNDISWAEGADPERDPPSIILVAFDKYSGPSFTPDGSDAPYQDSEGKLIVPIQPTRQDFQYKNNACWREQFPLVIAYAITVHKAQGVTLSRAVCDVSDPEFASGLSYVAVSRVSTLGGLMFDSPFSMDRVSRNTPGRTMQLRINDYIRRQGLVLSQRELELAHPFSDVDSSESNVEIEESNDSEGSEGF